MVCGANWSLALNGLTRLLVSRAGLLTYACDVCWLPFWWCCRVVVLLGVGVVVKNEC